MKICVCHPDDEANVRSGFDKLAETTTDPNWKPPELRLSRMARRSQLLIIDTEQCDPMTRDALLGTDDAAL